MRLRRLLLAIALLLVPTLAAAQTPRAEPAPAIVAPVAGVDHIGLSSLLAVQSGRELLVAPAPRRGWLLPPAATGLALGSTALGLGVTFLLPSLQFRAQGRPSPLVSGAGIGLGFGVGVAASQLLVPLAASLGDPRVSPEAARAHAWRLSRWAVLAGAVGTGVLLTGSAMEQQRFGAGQGAMGVGAAVVTTSALTYLVLEIVGVATARP